MEKKPSLRDVYPILTHAELKEAEANLVHYAAVAHRIVERIRASVDNDPPLPTMKERSKVFLKK